MSSILPRDLAVLQLDPAQEISGVYISRKRDRRLPEFPASQINFFQCLLLMVECLLPMCKGHRKFGVTVEDNIAVIFRHHEHNKEAVYVPYYNPICRPLRVPLDRDVLLAGVKWRFMGSNPLPTAQGIFDCFLASLRYMMLNRDFCLECLFAHSNGMGLCLERFLKTALYHITCFGRYHDRETYKPISRYEKGMDLKFRRIWWGPSNQLFKHNCVETKRGFKEETSFEAMNPHFAEMSVNFQNGFFIEPTFGLLRNLDSISKINVAMQCSCDSGRVVTKQIYTGLLRKDKKSDLYSIVLAKWGVNGDEYEDPLWNWSLMGSERPSAFVQQSTATPLVRDCARCQSQISIRDISVPDTTWLFMADIAEPLSKASVEGFSKINTYILGGVTFRLGFILIYNTTTGVFSSMNIKGSWKFFDDSIGGIFKPCNPNRVKYKDRINVRAFYYRKTEADPHRCLKTALSRL